ncbi:MAG: hypothetical protein AAGA88_04800 [Pseudomonadota bacterium]
MNWKELNRIAKMRGDGLIGPFERIIEENTDGNGLSAPNVIDVTRRGVATLSKLNADLRSVANNREGIAGDENVVPFRKHAEG